MNEPLVFNPKKLWLWLGFGATLAASAYVLSPFFLTLLLGGMFAVALTPILHFATDVSVRITDEGTTTYVDMRSAARFGYHDLGDNARRIADFLLALDAAVTAQPLDQTEEPAAGQ